ncbi:Zinc-finger homeodomain protein 1, partial [Mucuna pruriens]
MEFDEHEDQEEEEEEEEEEMGFPVAAAAAGYDSLGNAAARSKMSATEGVAATVNSGRKGGSTGTVRYRECQKNHAVSIGGHAVDGCCEFLAAGEEGTLEAVICAACNCHRNFHRKEIDGEINAYHQQPRSQPQPQPLHPQYHHQFSPYYHRAPPPSAGGYLHHHMITPPVSHHRPLALQPLASGGVFSREEEDMSNPSSSGGGGFGGGGGSGSGTKKRHRTKFTQEQKDKMLAFAEKLGWRIQKHDEAAVEQFCEETCVKRHVLKPILSNVQLGMDRTTWATQQYLRILNSPKGNKGSKEKDGSSLKGLQVFILSSGDSEEGSMEWKYADEHRE